MKKLDKVTMIKAMTMKQPTTNDKRTFLLLPLLLLALLTACVAPIMAPTTNPSASVDAASTAVAEEPVATTNASACAAGFRLFDHELLATAPVCIPNAPERIIALDMASVELTLLTDKTLLATSNWILGELPLLAPQLAETLAGVEDVGYPANLEKILLLKPDLILAVGGTSVGDTIDDLFTHLANSSATTPVLAAQK